MSGYRDILRNRNFFCLWLGQIISQLGDRLGQMALIGFVYSRTPGSSFEIFKILLFTIIPVFLLGPVAGVYVDRWDRRRTMYICDFMRAVLILLLALLFNMRSLALVYFVIFLAFCIGRFFVLAKMSIIPELVRGKDLLMANSLVHITGMIAAILGFGVSGVIVEWWGAQSGFYLDSLSFVVSAFLIFLIVKKHEKLPSLKDLSLEIVQVIRKSVFQEFKEGLAYFIAKKDIRFAASIIFVLWAALGAVYVVIIVFVQKTLHSITKDLGFLAMFLGVGLFLGSVIYGRYGRQISHYKTIFASLVASGIMLVVFAALVQRYPSFFIAALLSLSLGVLVSPIMIASNTIIHNVSENDMMGKIFSSLEIIMHLGFVIFMFLSSILAKFIPEGLILASIGYGIIGVGVLNLIYHRKIPWLNGVSVS